jgi:hypothetical protein
VNRNRWGGMGEEVEFPYLGQHLPRLVISTSHSILPRNGDYLRE